MGPDGRRHIVLQSLIPALGAAFIPVGRTTTRGPRASSATNATEAGHGAAAEGYGQYATAKMHFVGFGSPLPSPRIGVEKGR